MVNEVDKEATGYLQFPSFLSLMSKKYSDQNAEDEIREAFRVFDGVSSHAEQKQHLGDGSQRSISFQDGNGFINRQELRVVMMNLGEKLNDDEIECLIDDVDIDGDGQGGNNATLADSERF